MHFCLNICPYDMKPRSVVNYCRRFGWYLLPVSSVEKVEGVCSSGASASSIRLQDVTSEETVNFIVSTVRTTFSTFHCSLVHIRLLFKTFIFFALSIIYYFLTVKPVYVFARNASLWSMRWDAEYKCDASASPQSFGVLECVLKQDVIAFL